MNINKAQLCAADNSPRNELPERRHDAQMLPETLLLERQARLGEHVYREAVFLAVLVDGCSVGLGDSEEGMTALVECVEDCSGESVGAVE